MCLLKIWCCRIDSKAQLDEKQRVGLTSMSDIVSSGFGKKVWLTCLFLIKQSLLSFMRGSFGVVEFSVRSLHPPDCIKEFNVGGLRLSTRQRS